MKPSLLILAAGIGSRYGGLKQLDKIGPSGETIVDYSIYDAIRAGFEKIIFVIKEDIEADFHEAFVERLRDKIRIDYVFQEIWMVPQGIQISDNRQKPWGTGHAVLMAEDKIKEPFAVINSDDFYGHEAYEALVQYYSTWSAMRRNDYCMIGYKLQNTLSDFGAVSRGVCSRSDDGFLVNIVERTKIERTPEGIIYTDESNQKGYLPPETVVSMNFWGFTPSVFDFLRKGFEVFIKNNATNPKAEFYIPYQVNELMIKNLASIRILDCNAGWFGMTYREDRTSVVNKIRTLVKTGTYPENLWGF
jgi:UTP-glucose-1-phosphate uridylyltransferase